MVENSLFIKKTNLKDLSLKAKEKIDFEACSILSDGKHG